MGDSRRFDLFAKLTERHVRKDAHIVDVASGKGYLQAALRRLGYTHVTSWDKRKKNGSNRRGYRYGYFDYRTKECYDAVLAMHPDEATDHAILYAAKHHVPALICPCCIKPSAQPYWGQHTYGAWVEYLAQTATQANLNVQETKLKMNGRSIVLILKP